MYDKTDAGRLTLELEPVSLLQLLSSTAHAFAASLAHKSLTLTTTIDALLPANVLIDPHR